jgi:protein involved in polysaccharide export with SLBB domain
MPPTFAPLSMTPVPSDYVIGPEDELRIRVCRQVNFQPRYTNNPTGAKGRLGHRNAVKLGRPTGVLVYQRAEQHQMEGPAALKDANLFETRKGQAD